MASIASWRNACAAALSSEEDAMTEQPTIILPRRNFLVRALGFTLAGATVPVAIITADDAKARITHHQAKLERAWRDYYGPGMDIRTMDQKEPAGLVTDQGNNAISVFLIAAGGNRPNPAV
jgi:hypothetical protein